ncbi:hypothetical protein BBJ28_00012501 [Nothophytophthora sp. Chile5]|nr:hypothetical protein BBJ28_00012501 [Nothophytophthora sp. Chile5]
MTGKEALLRLLLLPEPLETTEAWASALKADNSVEPPSATRSEQAEAETAGREAQESTSLMAAVDAVVPHLPEYSTLSPKLKALLIHCEQAYPAETDGLVRSWLQRTPKLSSVPFRRWVLCDWLRCSHLKILMTSATAESADCEMLLQWRHALFVAALNESVQPLKRTLLRLLHEVDAALSLQWDEAADQDGLATASAAIQSITNVEDLLDFYWFHAEQLAPFAMVCAAKLHALALQALSNAAQLAEDDGVLVRLRWSLILKPLLFKPLVQHAMALKFFAGKEVATRLHMSAELNGLVTSVDFATREKILTQMTAKRAKLEHAYVSSAEHVHRSPDAAQEDAIEGDAARKYLAQLSVAQMKLLVAELERELDEAPPHLFSQIFLFFSFVLSALYAPVAAEEQELAAVAVDVLFALFDRRSHDESSCLDVLALLLHQPLTDHHIWEDNAELYLGIAESLSEGMVLQPSRTVKWTTRMALQQLLFECAARVLEANYAPLTAFLPQSLVRLVAIRLGTGQGSIVK